jgi:Lrp/AsnC family transcriptional regulator, leucine-responsive regulatory protein
MAKGLDRTDLQLLAELQESNLHTTDDLAARVGRSPSIVARRLRRLRSTGAISAEVAVLSDAAARNPMFALVQVQLERHSPGEYAALRNRLRASPNVQQFFEISGSFDLMLIVIASDMDVYNEVARDLLMDQPIVRRFETTFVKKRVKTTLAMPLGSL